MQYQTALDLKHSSQRGCMEWIQAKFKFFIRPLESDLNCSVMQFHSCIIEL